MTDSRMSVRFDVTVNNLARAMAIAARDELVDVSDEDEAAFVDYVRAMGKGRAMRALRECFWSYGAQSWPDDLPIKAYGAALELAREWLR